MLNKLSLRNAKRSSKDYVIYVATMSFIAGLMYAFNSMIFSESLKEFFSDMAILGVFITLGSVFIIFVIIWLVHYVITFTFERRSKEFGIYFLLGVKKKKIIKMFQRENMLLALLILVLGIIPGMLFQIAIINVFQTLFNINQFSIPMLNIYGVLLTIGYFLFAYCIALFRVKRAMKKMNIQKLLYLEKQNEEIVTTKGNWTKVFVPLSVIYIVFFNVSLIFDVVAMDSLIFLLLGLVIAIYLLYIGLSAFFASFMNRKPKMMFQKENFFIFRQLSSKVKTMRFTLGTLTVLFTLTLLSWLVVMMFTDYQSTEIQSSLPIDVYVMSDDKNENFVGQRVVLLNAEPSAEIYQYTVYQNDGQQFINQQLSKDHGEVDKDGNRKKMYNWYYDFDTFIGASDYNKMREMSGYETVSVGEGYLIHTFKRIQPTVEQALSENNLVIDGDTLESVGVRHEKISQNGMNGADYIIVVPDKRLQEMQPQYNLLIANLPNKNFDGLTDKLQEIDDRERGASSEDGEWGAEDVDELFNNISYYRTGSNTVISYGSPILVRENVKVELGSVLVTMSFVLGYIGIVFVVTALLILAMQQLSDATRYRKRYEILKQLGISKMDIRQTIFKQLLAYYICPFIISIAITFSIGIVASNGFVYYTEVATNSLQYYALTVLVFTFIYAIYFFITYLSFTKNIEKTTGY